MTFVDWPPPYIPGSSFKASKLRFTNSSCASFVSVSFPDSPILKTTCVSPIPPSVSLSSCVCPFCYGCLTLTYTITSLFSPPHPSLLLSSPLFPAPRYMQSLLSPSNNTLLVLCGGRPRKTRQLLGCCGRIQWLRVDWGPLLFTLQWSLCCRQKMTFLSRRLPTYSVK